MMVQNQTVRDLIHQAGYGCTKSRELRFCQLIRLEMVSLCDPTFSLFISTAYNGLNLTIFCEDFRHAALWRSYSLDELH
jgi:hypothetical protein